MRNKTSDQEGGGSLLYPEKYENPFFIDKYTALWAYGYKNGIGYSEGLYRTINELGFTYFERNGNYKILVEPGGLPLTMQSFLISLEWLVLTTLG